MHGLSKDGEELVAAAKGLGFTACRTAKGHLRFDAPGIPPVFASGTPSDHRSHKNALSKLQRAMSTKTCSGGRAEHHLCTQEVMGNGQVKTTAECRACGASDISFSRVVSGLVDPEKAFMRAFRCKGWTGRGGKEGSVRCPKCKGVAATIAPAAPKTPPSPVARPVDGLLPRVRVGQLAPNQKARGEIVRTISRNWLSAELGYKVGWSDEKVAEVTKFPLEWVAQLREYFMGPLPADGLGAQIRREMESIRRDLHTYAQTTLAQAAEIETRLAHLNTLLREYDNGNHRLCESVDA